MRVSHIPRERSESDRSNTQVSEFGALSNRLYSGRYINRTDGQPFVFAATVPDLGHERCGCTMFRFRVQPAPWRTTIKMKRSTILDNADAAVNLWWELGLRDPDHQPNLCRACIECQSSFSVCNEQALYDRFAAVNTPPLFHPNLPVPYPATVDRLVPLWVWQRIRYASNVLRVRLVRCARSPRVDVAQQVPATRLVRVSVICPEYRA
jgi:hypothetical protein